MRENKTTVGVMVFSSSRCANKSKISSELKEPEEAKPQRTRSVIEHIMLENV